MQNSNQDRMKALQDRAKDLQARLGYLYLQEKQLLKERETIEVLLQDGEREFTALQQAAQASVAPQDGLRSVPEIIEG